MTKVIWPFFSFRATKKSMLAMDENLDELDAGFFVGLEDQCRLLQEDGKMIELERGYKYIYREKPTATGRKIVRQRYFIPYNPQTTIQQENRAKFSDGVAAWQVLPFTTQIIWNKLKYPNHMSGYNRFLRAYMRGEI
jgi:hypothetical protein